MNTAGDGGRRYLAFNSLGCITLRSEGDHNAVEVTFHDTARMRRRIPLFKDFYNLSMASLGEKVGGPLGISRREGVRFCASVLGRLECMQAGLFLHTPMGTQTCANMHACMHTLGCLLEYLPGSPSFRFPA